MTLIVRTFDSGSLWLQYCSGWPLSSTEKLSQQGLSNKLPTHLFTQLKLWVTQYSRSWLENSAYTPIDNYETDWKRLLDLVWIPILQPFLPRLSNHLTTIMDQNHINTYFLENSIFTIGNPSCSGNSYHIFIKYS